MAILYRGHISGADFTATLLDLARRGYLKIEEITGLRGAGKDDESYRFTLNSDLPPDAGSLTPYEQKALDLLFAQGQEVTLEEFQAYAKEHAKEVAESWTQWGKEVQEASKVRNFYGAEAKKAVVADSNHRPFSPEHFLPGPGSFGGWSCRHDHVLYRFHSCGQRRDSPHRTRKRSTGSGGHFAVTCGSSPG